MQQNEKDVLRYRDLEVLGYGSRTTIWRRVRAGIFPSPVDGGFGNPIWLREDVEEWRSSCPRLRSQAAA